MASRFLRALEFAASTAEADMRRCVVFITSGLLGIALWAGGEALAYAAPPTSSLTAMRSAATCQPTIAKQAMAGLKVGLTLSQARACWPNAIEAPTGLMTAPGEYLIPHASGWIHAGWTIRASNGPATSDQVALAYSCGRQITWTVQSWEQWLDYINFATGDVVSTCYDAWSTWQTPACSGFGKCLAPLFGVLGQRTATVNPWYNQTVDYLAMTEFFYCRHYISDQNAISAYCD
jgi:hypothetical protein